MLVLGGRLVDPAAGLNAERDLLLRDGRVAAVETPGGLRDLYEAEVVDAVGCIVVPGLIDLHVHLREPGQTWKETIATGTRAAAKGGITTVVAMPNTVPVNDSVETLAWMLAAERNAAVRLLAMPAATRGSMGTTLTDFDSLVRGGAVGFTDDGKPVLEDGIMRAALVAAARLGVLISQHAEDTRLTALTGGSSGVNAGALAFRLGLRGMTIEAESRLVERDIALLRDIEQREGLRPHLHVQHVSTARALEAICAAKQDGLHVTCEATPHHFTLTEDALRGYDTNAKMNPPLRSALDRDAVIAGLLSGTVDCIATDHAPHARYEKEVEFDRASNGITGLETSLGLALRVLGRDHGATISKIVTLMSTHPAALLGRRDLGTLATGSMADLVVFDPDAEWTFSATESLSRSENTPFVGSSMLGQIRTTLLEGRVIYADDSVTA